jgi:CheY-like chemotaxis protein
MPNTSGIEALAHLRQAASRPHIVMVTSDNSAASVAHARQLGANDYLLKPFSADQIAAIALRYLEKRG